MVVIHRGGHTSFYNSKAMAMAGLTKNTPVRFGGTFDKDASGELNGRVTDNARDIFNGVGKSVTYSPAETERRAGELQSMFHFGRLEHLVAPGLGNFLDAFLERLRDLGERIAQDFLVPAAPYLSN